MIMVKSPAFVTCLILKVYVYFKINENKCLQDACFSPYLTHES